MKGKEKNIPSIKEAGEEWKEAAAEERRGGGRGGRTGGMCKGPEVALHIGELRKKLVSLDHGEQGRTDSKSPKYALTSFHVLDGVLSLED